MHWLKTSCNFTARAAPAGAGQMPHADELNLPSNVFEFLIKGLFDVRKSFLKHLGCLDRHNVRFKCGGAVVQNDDDADRVLDEESFACIPGLLVCVG